MKRKMHAFIIIIFSTEPVAASYCLSNLVSVIKKVQFWNLQIFRTCISHFFLVGTYTVQVFKICLYDHGLSSFVVFQTEP